MKTISSTLSLLVLVLTIFNSCKPPIESQLTTLTHEDSLEIAQLLNRTAPLIASEYFILRKSAEIAFSVLDEDEATGFRYVFDKEMLFKLDEFETYINQPGFEGIRFYPGLTESDELVIIMCRANKDNSTENDYVLLQAESATPNSFPQPNEDLAKDLYARYLEKVLIYFESQTNLDSDIREVLTFSRYYSTSEVLQYIQQNLEGSNTPHDNLRVRFAFGYVPDELSQKLKLRIGDTSTNANHMQGFTVMLNLADNEGDDMIDQTARYQTNNYKGRYLEVGHPCPPRCGVLHQ